MKCTNHADREATHTAAMKVATKQPDGSYSTDMPLCSDCAPRIELIGFKITQRPLCGWKTSWWDGEAEPECDLPEGHDLPHHDPTFGDFYLPGEGPDDHVC